MLLLSLQASDKEKRELWPFMRQSVQNQDQVSTSPLPPSLTVVRTRGRGGGGIWTWPGWSGKSEPEMSSLSNGIQVLYISIWKRLGIWTQILVPERENRTYQSSDWNLETKISLSAAPLMMTFKELRGGVDHYWVHLWQVCEDQRCRDIIK